MTRERSSKGGSIISRVAVLLAATAILASCHPTQEEGERAREAERQQAIAGSRKTLLEFADRYNAVPVELFDSDPLAHPFTAQRQQQLEGKIVAFSASLLDVVRLPSQAYELVLGSPFFGATVVKLKASDYHANKFLARPRDPFSSVLVVAQINEVIPLTLKLEPCHEPDCSEVALETDHFGFGRPLRITGEAIDIEPEQLAGTPSTGGVH
jgi:hypothetical protein